MMNRATAQPWPDKRKREREVFGRQLVVPRCDPATALDLVEEPLDQIAGDTDRG
jgi:hypothetical protein